MLDIANMSTKVFEHNGWISIARSFRGMFEQIKFVNTFLAAPGKKNNLCGEFKDVLFLKKTPKTLFLQS